MTERVRTSDGRRGMLSLLRDVTGTPQAGDTLVWDDVDKHWEPAAPGAASVPDASTTIKGKVELATDGETAAGVVVQGNDGRLSNARTPTSHTHDESDVTGLVSDLAAKATPGDITSAVSTHEAASDPHTGYQRESEKGAANGYASLGADGLVPSAQLPAAGGGSDPWTKVVLGSDHTTSATANGAVAGLAFTPAAGKRYLVEVARASPGRLSQTAGHGFRRRIARRPTRCARGGRALRRTLYRQECRTRRTVTWRSAAP